MMTTLWIKTVNQNETHKHARVHVEFLVEFGLFTKRFRASHLQCDFSVDSVIIHFVNEATVGRC